MNITILLKDTNFMDVALNDIHEIMESEGRSEDDIEEAQDAFRANFQYGELLRLDYDIDTDELTPL